MKYPSPDCPLLVGILVDVSASMTSSIQNRSFSSQNRLESFRDSLEGLVKKAGELARERSSGRIAQLLKLFAYGFGFGNPLSFLLGRSRQNVRDLLAIPQSSDSTVSIDKLVSQWPTYRSHVEGMVIEMFGNTPMIEALGTANQRLAKERSSASYSDNLILFILSDGEPTDGPAESAIGLANEIKQTGVLISPPLFFRLPP